MAGLVAKKALSVRDTEALVRRLHEPGRGRTAGRAAPRDPDIRRLELELADKLGAKVMFQHAASGKGKLVVTYNSLDELEGILAHIMPEFSLAAARAPLYNAPALLTGRRLICANRDARAAVRRMQSGSFRDE